MNPVNAAAALQNMFLRPPTEKVILTFSFTSSDFDKVALQSILNDPFYKAFLPPQSLLSQTSFTVYSRFASPSHLLCCNYTATAALSQNADIVCICNTPHFAPHRDEHHGHIFTNDLSCFSTEYPELYATLCLGPKFRSSYVESEKPFIDCVLDKLLSYVKIAMRNDPQFPQLQHYQQWLQAIRREIAHRIRTQPPPASFHHAILSRPGANRRFREQLALLHNHFVFTLVDKAANSYAIVCKKHLSFLLPHKHLNVAHFARVPRLGELGYSLPILTQLARYGIPRDSNPHDLSHPQSFNDVPFCYATLKMHKDPFATRMLVAVAHTLLAALSRLLSYFLQACIEELHSIWIRLGLLIGIDVKGCWIVKNSTEVIPKLKNIFSHTAACAFPMTVLDFEGMYNLFDLQDIKDQFSWLLPLLFQNRSGADIFSTVLDDFYDHRHRRNPSSHFLILYKTYTKDNHTPLDTEYCGWVRPDYDFDTLDRQGRKYVKLDAPIVSDMLALLLDNAFVQFQDQFFRQIKGIAMGTNAAPQIANLYCAVFETKYILSQVTSWCNSAPLLRTPDRLSHITALFNISRFIDDILAAGLAIDALNLLQSILFDIYPRTIIRPGVLIPDPFVLTIAHQGRNVPFLDLCISLSPYTPEQLSTVRTSLYNKLDDLPIDHLRFPHPHSKLSNRVKLNVLYSQLIRYTRLFSKPSEFRVAAVRLIVDMVRAGYNLAPLRSTFLNFQMRYAAIHYNTFSVRLTVPVVRAIWRFAIYHLCRALLPAHP
jgi:hypothetical protein